MEKRVILLIVLIVIGTFIMVWFKSNSREEVSKLFDSDIRGRWDLILPIENSGWSMTSYYFYGNNKCSLASVISTASGVNTLVDDECTYKISGLNIYIDGDLLLRYDENKERIVYTDESDLEFIKMDADPCSTIYSHC